MKAASMWNGEGKKYKDPKSLAIRRHDYPKMKEHIFHLGKPVALANWTLQECIWTI